MVIDACMRDGDSRTRRILEPLVAELGKRYEIETVRLDGGDYAAVGRKVLAERSSGYVPEETVALARRLAGADRIVIAAPFWDMSFPSALKVFFENMSLFHITFDSDNTHCYGLCKCSKVLYITTRGMDIHTGDPLEQATPYIRALSYLWGLGDLFVISAENMDYSTPEEIDLKVSAAISEGISLCRTF